MDELSGRQTLDSRLRLEPDLDGAHAVDVYLEGLDRSQGNGTHERTDQRTDERLNT